MDRSERSTQRRGVRRPDGQRPGVDASDLNFSLEFAPLTLAVTDGALQLNSVSGVGATKLLPGMVSPADRYLRPDHRDFLAVTLRGAP